MSIAPQLRGSISNGSDQTTQRLTTGSADPRDPRVGHTARARRRRREQDAFFRREEDKWTFVDDTLTRCDELKDKMLGILDSFETKLSSLEHTMLPIHRQTQGLTTAQRNIDACLIKVAELMEHQRVADDEPTHSVDGDYDAYIAWVECVNAGIHYFQQHAHYKNADKSLRKLHEHSKKAMIDCEKAFKRTFIAQTRASTVESLDWPAGPSGLTPVMNYHDVRLCGSLASMLDKMGIYTFQQVMRDSRSDALRMSLKHAFKSGSSTGIIRESDEKNARSILLLHRTARYQRGSHLSIFLLKFFIDLLEREHQCINDVLKYTSMSSVDRNVVFLDTVAQPVDYFVRKAAPDVLLKDRRVGDRLIIILDVIDNLVKVMPRYELLLRTANTEKSLAGRVSQFRDSYVQACNKALNQYVDYVQQFSARSSTVSAKQLAKDGTVYTLTIEILNFAKRLSGFKDIIELISESLTSLENAKADAATLLGVLLTIIFNALESNLETRARAYKISALRQIFLLNNYDYILKHLKQSQLIKQLGPRFMDRYELLIRTARENYQHVTWSKALSYLDMSDSKEILEKCDPMQNSAKKAIKSKFAGFNSHFENLYATQRHFSVPDSDLRSQLRNDNVEYVIHKYKDFVETYGSLPFSTQINKYNKYSITVIDGMLNKFFDEDM
jgi:exocyst complex component 7